MEKILLVEDDPNFGAVMQSYLRINNYNVTWITDGSMAVSAFFQHKFDLCILDVMLPKLDGFSILKEIRKKGSSVPVIFLTAKTLKKDIVEGYLTGADDYITKPFDSELLLLKINAILKRKEVSGNKSRTEVFSLGRYSFNYPKRTLQSGDKIVRLSPKEAGLLYLLCENQGNVLDRNQALAKIWGEESFFTTRSMDVYITKLRKYLCGDPNISITNIHGSGFILSISS
ncbi:MAG: response regulator transcription factor [Bacteroidota bacterium]